MYVIYYSLIGSRINGSYMVNAPNKREARKVFKNNYDGQYRPVIEQVQSLKEYATDYGWDSVEECLQEDLHNFKMPQEGKIELIEAGT